MTRPTDETCFDPRVALADVGGAAYPEDASGPNQVARALERVSQLLGWGGGHGEGGPFGSVVLGQHRIPMRVAVSTTFAAPMYGSPPPISARRFAYAMFTELTDAVSSEIVP